MTYDEYLYKKKVLDIPTGISNIPDLCSLMMPFQHDITSWALRRGRACIFADCGMGKTIMQLEWARCVPGDVLIFAPLAVAEQTIREGEKFGITGIQYSGDGIKSGKITITNYERIEKFNPADYVGIVLDESSIIKSFNGKYRTELIENWTSVPFRLACTATPAPNDFMELGNHAEFVGSMTRTEMLSMFFVHDGGETSKWRLKGHAESEFWEWVCSWAVMIQKPSDLGYNDEDYILPSLSTKQISVQSEKADEGFLFAMEAQTLSERIRARRNSIEDRAAEVLRLINSNSEQWIVWCNLNSEGDAIEKLCKDAVQVSGSDSNDKKIQVARDFVSGKIRVLVSKVSIFGYGLNLQNCHNVVFFGLSDSYEDYYQAIRRCWRFGQKKAVKCYVVTADIEGAIVKNIHRKEDDARKMALEMVRNMSAINTKNIRGTTKTVTGYNPTIQMKLPGWVKTKEF